MVKDEILRRLEIILFKNNIPFEKYFPDNFRIEILIPTKNNEDSIHIFIMDTDQKETINEYGIKVINFQEDDELSVYGFGIDKETNGVITLRNISVILKKHINSTFKIEYQIGCNFFEEYIGGFTKDNLQTKIHEIEAMKGCKIKKITDYYQEIRYETENLKR